MNFKFYKNNYFLLIFLSIFLFSCSSSNNDNLSEDNTNQQDATTKVIEARPLNTTNSWAKNIKFNFYNVSLLGIRNFLASPEQHSDSTDLGSGSHNIETWDSFGNEIIDSIVSDLGILPKVICVEQLSMNCKDVLKSKIYETLSKNGYTLISKTILSSIYVLNDFIKLSESPYFDDRLSS